MVMGHISTPTGSQLVYFAAVRLGLWDSSPVVLTSHRRDAELSQERSRREVFVPHAYRINARCCVVGAVGASYFGIACVLGLVSRGSLS